MRNAGVLLLTLIALIAPAVAAAQAPAPASTTLVGSLDGAPYRIVVPENWGGSLLVYVHGYNESADPPMVAPPNIGEAALLSRGFALAASQFRASGLAIKEGLQDTLALTAYFRERVGLPRRTVVWGRSMGGLITLGLVEKFPGIYDAGVALCPNAAGTALRWDRGLDFAVAYAAAFGWPDGWGTVGDVRDDLDWYVDVMPFVAPTLAPAKRSLWEFVRLVNRLPVEGFYVPAAPDPLPYRLAQVLFATVTRGQYEARAGGRPTQNLDHSYTLSPAEKAYLAGLGLDAEPLLVQMNGMKFDADRQARNYADHYLTPEGNSPRPVLTVHTITDAVVTTDHESVLKARYEAFGNAANLFQAFTTPILTPAGATYCTHCAFTAEQTLTALDAMTAWLNTGTRPSAASFPAAQGFDQSYVAPAWPWPY